ncbi:Uncharacterised protein [Streptococcus pneumoniae]|nr:Uncharacterised protein [Streptococcus pneumoniae]
MPYSAVIAPVSSPAASTTRARRLRPLGRVTAGWAEWERWVMVVLLEWAPRCGAVMTARLGRWSQAGPLRGSRAGGGADPGMGRGDRGPVQDRTPRRRRRLSPVPPRAGP